MTFEFVVLIHCPAGSFGERLLISGGGTPGRPTGAIGAGALRGLGANFASAAALADGLPGSMSLTFFGSGRFDSDFAFFESNIGSPRRRLRDRPATSPGGGPADYPS